MRIKIDPELEQYIPHHGNYGKPKPQKGSGETSERRKIAREYKNQGLSYSEIGKLMGISRQRAQQLVAPTDLAVRQLRRKLGDRCSVCGMRKKKLDLHHADYSKPPEVLLCVRCHMRKDITPGPTHSELVYAARISALDKETP